MASPSRKNGLRCGAILSEGRRSGRGCQALLLEKGPELGLGVRCRRRECRAFHPLSVLLREAVEQGFLTEEEVLVAISGKKETNGREKMPKNRSEVKEVTEERKTGFNVDLARAIWQPVLVRQPSEGFSEFTLVRSLDQELGPHRKPTTQKIKLVVGVEDAGGGKIRLDLDLIFESPPQLDWEERTLEIKLGGVRIYNVEGVVYHHYEGFIDFILTRPPDRRPGWGKGSPGWIRIFGNGYFIGGFD